MWDRNQDERFAVDFFEDRVCCLICLFRFIIAISSRAWRVDLFMILTLPKQSFVREDRSLPWNIVRKDRSCTHDVDGSIAALYFSKEKIFAHQTLTWFSIKNLSNRQSKDSAIKLCSDFTEALSVIERLQGHWLVFLEISWTRRNLSCNNKSPGGRELSQFLAQQEDSRKRTVSLSLLI